MKRTCAVLTVVAAGALVAEAAFAATLTKSFTQQAKVAISTTASGCNNNPGPYITIDGALTLSGVDARIILTNNTHFTHVASTDVVADVALIPVGQSISIRKQPSQGGVGGNPWIYFQFCDPNGKSLTQYTLLGRCVQGLLPSALDLVIPNVVNTSVTTGGCTNSGGPNITISGALVLGGLNGRLVFTNNAKFTHAAGADVVVNVVLIPQGQTLTFAKQPPLGGAGGNPIIYVQFLNGKDKSPLSAPIKLGRCNQL